MKLARARSRTAAVALGLTPEHIRRRLAQSLTDGRLRGSRYSGGLRRALIRCDDDPAVEIDLCGFRLELPLSHSLPQYRRQDPTYAENLGEVARLVSELGGATMVDIGANVGDSAAIVKSYAPSMAILCVDADPAYEPFLRRNTAQWPDVEIAAPVLLSDRTEALPGTLARVRGTSKFVASDEEQVAAVSLDELLARRRRFQVPALLKSDTDGFEDHVLRGAQEVLAAARPVLFLEYDPKLLRASGSDGLRMLRRLRPLGYERIAFYDKFGTRMVRGDLSDDTLLSDLDAYAESNSPRGVDHYDVVVAPAATSSLIDHLAIRPSHGRGRQARAT